MTTLFLVLFLAGCGGVQGVAARAGGVLVKPVFGLIVSDAQTTEKWIDAEVAAGRMDADTAVLARQCPSAVLALDKLRDDFAARVAEAGKGEEGFKGLIYFGTKNRYGTGESMKTEAVGHIEKLMATCTPLIPAEKLLLRLRG